MRTEWEQQSAGGHRAVLELGTAEATALGDALSYYLRRRFGACELELSAKALALRSLTGVADRLGLVATAEAGGLLVLSEDELRNLREALCLYLAERDVESYQPPEERGRLTELHALAEPLGDLLARLPRPPAPAADYALS